MAVFHFRFDRGLGGGDEPFDVDLSDVAEAQLEAIALLAELLRAQPHRLVEVGDGCLVVSDESRLDLFRLDVGLFLAPVLQRTEQGR